MKLFSKRNKYRDPERFRYPGHIYRRNRTELISQEARNRILAEIKFLTSQNDFLEWFILFENQKQESIFFDVNKINSFSLSELGYKMSDFFAFENFAIIEQETKSQISEKTEKFFDDYKLFDLAEIVILFSKDEKRVETIQRFNAIFSEEGTDYEIIEHLITKKAGETLRTLTSLLKDDNLKKKLNNFYESYQGDEYVNAAKISADILNIIFSGFIKNNKPKDISHIKERLAEKIVRGTSKKQEKKDQFISYLDDLLKNAKNLNNNIYDIRHTEKSTIELTNDYIYKLVARQNMSLVELVLTSLKDDYVLGEDWEKIKTDYIKKYNINRDTRLIIEKPVNDDEIKIENIPF